MLKAIVSFAILAALCTGCTTVQKAYQTSSVVTPLGEGRYKVNIEISESGRDGPTVLSSPMIAVQAGREGHLDSGASSSSGEKEEGTFCTVLVSEHGDATEAKVSVVLKENGRETLNTTQTTIVKQ